MPNQARSLSLTLIVIVMLSLQLLTACTVGSPEEESTPTPIPTPIVPVKPTYTVQVGEVVSKLQFSGRVAPVLQQSLYFEVDGRVSNVYVAQGDLVTAGQVLADLESLERLERQLAMDQLALRRAEVLVEIAQRSLEISKLTIPTRDPTYEHSVAIKELELELAEIAQEEILLNTVDVEEAIEQAKLIAPFDGMVIRLSISGGKEAVGYRSAMILADISQLEVAAELGDDELSQLAEGMVVSMVPYGKPGTVIESAIRLLPFPYGSGDTAASNANASGLDTSNVRISLDMSGDESGYELGDLMRVTVILERKEAALWLPISAIRVFENRKFVLVQDGDVQRRVDVTLGIQGDDRVEILDGLSEGEVVIGP